MARKKGRKRAPASETATNEGKKVPKSFVLRRGKIGSSLKALVQDTRRLMAPFTALKLRESSKDQLKSLIRAAAVLEISHMLLYSQGVSGTPHLRVALPPSGPTLNFTVCKYSLMSDVRKNAKRYRLHAKDFESSPVFVLHGFKARKSNAGSDKLGNPETAVKLMVATLSNMVPKIDVATATPADCRRVVLFKYNKDTEVVSVRQYAVSRRPKCHTKGIQKLVNLTGNSRRLPNMEGRTDISDYLQGAAAVSDSEIDDRVEIDEVVSCKSDELQIKTTAVRLLEIGPRLELKLFTALDGFCTGTPLYQCSKE